jgi:hypothetical protein
MLTLFHCRKNGKDREGVFPSGSLEAAAHTFQEYTYKKITPCDVCSQVLRGAYRSSNHLSHFSAASWTGKPSRVRVTIYLCRTYVFQWLMIPSKVFDHPVYALWLVRVVLRRFNVKGHSPLASMSKAKLWTHNLR